MISKRNVGGSPWGRLVGIVALVLFTLGQSCIRSSAPQIFIGQSYFPRGGGPHISVFSKNLLEDLEEGGEYQVRGVYSTELPSLRTVAIVRVYDKAEGLGYLRLSRRLNIPEMALIDCGGTVISGPLLEPMDFQVIMETDGLRGEAQREYHRLRADLQDQIAQPGSHLVLPVHPAWDVLWCRTDESLICSARAYDLMYEATIQLVFDGRSRLRQVYAQEWFKGE